MYHSKLKLEYECQKIMNVDQLINKKLTRKNHQPQPLPPDEGAEDQREAQEQL
jgi:hypothetical protein